MTLRDHTSKISQIIAVHRGYSIFVNKISPLKLQTKQDFNNFFKANYRNSVIKANRILNNQAEAEDVVQDCLVKLWELKNQLKEGTIEGYFATMVRNRCIDQLRKKKPVVVDLDQLQLSTKDHSDLEYTELKIKIDNAIDRLPERCRQVFVLSRFEKMSHKEIAEALAISTKTVENQITKALKVIRSALLSMLFLIFF